MADSRFGKYVLSQKLGAGGMGEVWKAWDPELRRSVAIKFLKHDDPEEAKRFRREAQLAAGLTHPNIASIYDVGDVDGKSYIAMQCIDGHTLSAVARTDVRRIAALVRDASRAVHCAHEQGVIHRDLKPENMGEKP